MFGTAPKSLRIVTLAIQNSQSIGQSVFNKHVLPIVGCQAVQLVCLLRNVILFASKQLGLGYHTVISVARLYKEVHPIPFPIYEKRKTP